MMNNKCDPKTAAKIRKLLPFRFLIRFSKKWQLFRAILILIDFLFPRCKQLYEKIRTFFSFTVVEKNAIFCNVFNWERVSVASLLTIGCTCGYVMCFYERNEGLYCNNRN